MVNAQNNRYSNAVDTICQKIFWFASLCLVFCTFAPKTLKTLTCDYCSFFPQNCRSNDTLAELCSGHNSVSLKITRLFGNSEIFCASSDSVWYALTYAIKCFLSTQVGLMHASLAVIPFRVWPREPDVLKSEEKPRCFYSSWIDARLPRGYTFSRLAPRA